MTKSRSSFPLLLSPGSSSTVWNPPMQQPVVCFPVAKYRKAGGKKKVDTSFVVMSPEASAAPITVVLSGGNLKVGRNNRLLRPGLFRIAHVCILASTTFEYRGPPSAFRKSSVSGMNGAFPVVVPPSSGRLPSVLNNQPLGGFPDESKPGVEYAPLKL